MKSYEERMKEEWEKQRKEVFKNKFNLMIVGCTGSGKSSLINRIFGEKVAQVGSGKPVTEKINIYEKDNIPIRIFDTVGYELEEKDPFSENKFSENKFKESVLKEIEKRKTWSLDGQIHVIWYCISVANHRILPYDITIIKMFKRDPSIPIYIVFTKCDLEEEDSNGNGVTSLAFRDVLHREVSIDEKEIFETSSENSTDSFQLEDLIEATRSSIKDENLRIAFVSAQRASLKTKREESKKIVHIFTGTTAVTAGLNPVPMSDALVIVPQQIGMISKITSIYGFDQMGNSVLSLLESQLISFIGKQLVVSLTKFIPILGQILNAGVAGTLTTALGYAVIEIYEKASLAYLETGQLPVWADIFSGDIIIRYIKEYMKQNKSK